MIELYSGAISAIDLLAFGAVIAALGLTRILVGKVTKRNRQLIVNDSKKQSR